MHTQAAPIAIAWQNLSYRKTSYTDWNHFGQSQTILNDLHGSFLVNSLNGVLGCSGAGKTTLLKALSGNQNADGTLSPQSKIFTRLSPHQPVSYFTEQHVHETVHGELTVREVFAYAYQFKNGIQLSTASQTNAHINSVIAQLLLKREVLDRKFGQLSGGEMRRVVIGQELMGLQSPDFMFCDELTTGLDSYAALEVIRCLSLLVSSASNRQLTIIISLHVPSDELLGYFSQLYVLAKGGQAVYSGPPRELATFLKQTLPNYEEVENKEDQPIETLIRYSSSDSQRSIISTFVQCTFENEKAKIQDQHNNLIRQALPSNFKSYSISDQIILLRRQLSLALITQLPSFASQLLLFVLGLVLISTFFNRGMTTLDACYKLNDSLSSGAFSIRPEFSVFLRTFENMNYLYFNRLFQSFAFALIAVSSFNSLIPVFRSEHRNRWYSTTVFFTSTLIVNVVSVTIYALVLSTVSYFVVSEHAIDNYAVNWRRFFSHQLLIWLSMLYGFSIGEAVSVLLNDYLLSFAGTTFLHGSTMIMDNYFIVTDDIQWSVMRLGADLVGMKYFIKYLIYIFYGLERCEGEKERSWMMDDVRVDPQMVPYYVFRIVTFIIAAKAVTYALMMVKYSSFLRMRKFELPFRLTGKQISIIRQEKTHNREIIHNNNNHSLVRLGKDVFLGLKSTSEMKPHTLLAFTNLTLHSKRPFCSRLVDSKPTAHSRPILRNLNGQFTLGTFTGILGCSGAGKTSLLNVLNGQYAIQLSPETTLHVSNQTPIRKVFITQQVTNHLFSGLTAKQALVYASKLKNAAEKAKIDHQTTALKLLDELAMSEAANRSVEHLSGGQQRRLILACELTSLKMPNLILVDEAVSGLDTDSAEKVLYTLKAFAESRHITVVLTIHQPSTRFLSTFHQLYILSIGGVCVYSGTPSGVKEHLQLANIAAGKYPIETIIKLSSCGPEDEMVLKLRTLNTSNFKLLLDTTVSTESLPPNRTRFSPYSTWILLCRYFAYIASTQWILIAFITALTLVYGLLIRLLFNEADLQASGCVNLDEDFTSNTNSELAVAMMNTVKYNILTSVFLVLFLSVPSTYSLHRELPLFISEHQNGWYSTGAFLLSKTTTDLLPLIIPLVGFVHIINAYNLPGLYWHLFINLFLSVAISQATFHFFLVTCSSEVLSAICIEVYYLINVLLSNIMIPLTGSPVLDLISRATLFRHSMELLILRLYGFGRCQEREVHPVLHNMELSDGDYWTALLIMMANFAVWKCLTLYMLVRKVRSSKRRVINEQQLEGHC